MNLVTIAYSVNCYALQTIAMTSKPIYVQRIEGMGDLWVCATYDGEVVTHGTLNTCLQAGIRRASELTV